VALWTCPRCDRRFAKANQGHDCLPGITVAKLFVDRPPWQREVYDAIITHLRTLGPVHEDAVSVGVFLKVPKKLGEVRPKSRWVSLYLSLPRELHDARVARVIDRSRANVWHDIKLTSASDVDDQLCAWLTEAYTAAED
jgi:hypothetical protein